MQDPLPIKAHDGPFRSSIRVPGSKSLTNRFAVLAALSGGVSTVVRPLRSDDTDRLLLALAALGIDVAWSVEAEGESVRLGGGGGLLRRGGRVDLGDGGTPTRFLLALATHAAEEVVIDGSERMRERPVDEGIELLRALGADIQGTVRGGIERLPVVVRPRGPLAGGTLEVGRTASSQFLSALLLLAPAMRGPLTLRYREPPTSASYLDLTVHALRAVGARVEESRDAAGTLREHRVTPGPIAPFRIAVEADASSAAYFAVAAAAMPGSCVDLPGLPPTSVQPDIRLLGALEAMGARVDRGGPVLRVAAGSRLRGIDYDASDFPDASLALAVACARATGPSRLRGLRTLAVKESDRITALATELRRIGCRCEATAEALTIDPASCHDDPVTIATYRDHRMAMSFATLGRIRPGISIADPGCVAKSYPGFWADLDALGRYAGDHP